jgi:hypothetical protein
MTQGSVYTDEQRREAALQMALHGNAQHVSDLTGIPRRTLSDWTKQDWFQTILAEVRRENALELDARFTRVLDSATAALIYRIKNGDAVLVGGVQVHRPMSGKDLAVVAGIVFDKRDRARAPSFLTSGEPDPNYLSDLADFLRVRARGGEGKKFAVEYS